MIFTISYKYSRPKCKPSSAGKGRYCSAHILLRHCHLPNKRQQRITRIRNFTHVINS